MTTLESTTNRLTAIDPRPGARRCRCAGGLQGHGGWHQRAGGSRQLWPGQPQYAKPMGSVKPMGRVDRGGQPPRSTRPATPLKLGLTSRQESSGKVRWTICNLIPFAKGDSRVMSLGHPSYPRPKGTRNHSMAEKRGYVEIGETGPRKTRVAWSKLDRLNPNPDRGLSYSVVRPIEHDVIECRPFPFRGYGKPAR